jgi:hypothetical protein
MADRSDAAAVLSRRSARRGKAWTPSRVASFDTEEIAARLRRLGIDPSRDAYLELAERHTSAWDLSEEWYSPIQRRLSRDQKDFVSLAACELWKRYCPERPSVEMLDDSMQDGYRLREDRQESQACERWWEVWEIILRRLKHYMRACGLTFPVFRGTESLEVWLYDFAETLYHLARDEPRYAGMRVRLCEDVLDQFPDEDDLFLENFRSALGESLYLAGLDEAGERILLELIRDRPHRSVGYATLAEMLGRGRRGTPPIDLPRAVALLERALARPVEDAPDYDVEFRLEDMRRSLAEHPVGDG